MHGVCESKVPGLFFVPVLHSQNMEKDTLRVTNMEVENAWKSTLGNAHPRGHVPLPGLFH